MSWNPGGQYEPVASPWADYSVYSFPGCLPDRAGRPAAGDGRDERHHRHQLESNRTALDCGLVAFRQASTASFWSTTARDWLAFSVYRMLQVAGGRCHLPQRHRGAASPSRPRLVWIFYVRGAETRRGPRRQRQRQRPLRMANAQSDRLGGQRQDLRQGRAFAARRRPGRRPASGLCRDVRRALSGKAARTPRHDHARRLRPHQASPPALSRHGLPKSTPPCPGSSRTRPTHCSPSATRGYDDGIGPTGRCSPHEPPHRPQPISPGRRSRSPTPSHSCSGCRRNPSA